MKFGNTLALGTAICGLALSAAGAQAGVPEAGGPSATAQQPPATSSGPATAPAPQAPSPGTAPAGTTYSDAEIEQFAKAVLAVQKIQQDTTASATDKQTKMAAAVQGAGLTPAKFNEIASASNADPALMQRIQAAAGKVQSTAAAQ